jgi:hypothetical protein
MVSRPWPEQTSSSADHEHSSNDHLDPLHVRPATGKCDHNSNKHEIHSMRARQWRTRRATQIGDTVKSAWGSAHRAMRKTKRSTNHTSGAGLAPHTLPKPASILIYKRPGLVRLRRENVSKNTTRANAVSAWGERNNGHRFMSLGVYMKWAEKMPENRMT